MVSDEVSLSKRITFILIIIIGSALLPIAIVEGGGRAYIHFMYGIPGKSYGLWRYDAELGAQHAENGYNLHAETNNHGFRNKEDVLEPKPTDSYRIIAYGGSTTFCYYLSNDEAWPLQLQAVLRRHHHASDQVLNGGAIMWSLGHAFARAKKDIPILKPDYVLIYSGINEYANARILQSDGIDMAQLVNQGKYGVFAKNLDQNRWVKRNLISTRLADYVIAPWFHNHGENRVSIGVSVEPYILENYLAVLGEFIVLIQAYGGTPVFIIQTHNQVSADNGILTAYSREGAALARELGAVIVDAEELLDIYPGDPRDLFASSGVHYSKKGAELLGQLVYEQAFAPEALVSEKNSK